MLERSLFYRCLYFEFCDVLLIPSAVIVSSRGWLAAVSQNVSHNIIITVIGAFRSLDFIDLVEHQLSAHGFLAATAGHLLATSAGHHPVSILAPPLPPQPDNTKVKTSTSKRVVKKQGDVSYSQKDCLGGLSSSSFSSIVENQLAVRSFKTTPSREIESSALRAHFDDVVVPVCRNRQSSKPVMSVNRQ